jgi:hypothetical protein
MYGKANKPATVPQWTALSFEAFAVATLVSNGERARAAENPIPLRS